MNYTAQATAFWRLSSELASNSSTKREMAAKVSLSKSSIRIYILSFSRFWMVSPFNSLKRPTICVSCSLDSDFTFSMNSIFSSAFTSCPPTSSSSSSERYSLTYASEPGFYFLAGGRLLYPLASVYFLARSIRPFYFFSSFVAS